MVWCLQLVLGAAVILDPVVDIGPGVQGLMMVLVYPLCAASHVLYPFMSVRQGTWYTVPGPGRCMSIFSAAARAGFALASCCDTSTSMHIDQSRFHAAEVQDLS